MPDSESGRRGALLLAAVLAVALAVLIVVLTPWHPLPHAPAVPVRLRDYFTRQQISRSAAFHAAITWPAWLSLAASLTVPVALAFTRVGRPLLRMTRRRIRRWPLQVLALTAAAVLLARLVALPFDAWTHVVAGRYGLATSSWVLWGSDTAKSTAVTFVVAGLSVLGVVAAARRFPTHWYLPAAAAGIGLVFVVSFAYPVVVEPLFNSFTPLPQSPLRTRLLNLAAREGVDVRTVLVANASSRTTALNAYVSGFGQTRRIVIYDTLLHGSTPNEVAVIVAHELAHAAYDDVLTGTVEGALGAGLAVPLLYLLLTSWPLLRRASAGSARDPAVALAVVALATVGSFLAQPVQNCVSRQIEARADATALNLTRDPRDFIAVQRQLAVSNLSHLQPNPVLAFWFDDHPEVLARIEMAAAWEKLHGRRR